MHSCLRFRSLTTSVFSDRKIDVKGCALSELRFDANRSLMALDYPIAHRQTKAGAVHALGRIERFKNALAHFFFHAHSSIRKTELQSICLSLAADLQVSSLGHRIHGVYDQIDEDFTQLRRIAESQCVVFGIERN